MHSGNRNTLLGGVVLILALALAGSISAHHSVQAQFDIHKTFTVSGTVAKVEWINPHSYITVNVKDADGKITRWGFELGGGGSGTVNSGAQYLFAGRSCEFRIPRKKSHFEHT